jgi:hypothetical protein
MRRCWLTRKYYPLILRSANGICARILRSFVVEKLQARGAAEIHPKVCGCGGFRPVCLRRHVSRQAAMNAKRKILASLRLCVRLLASLRLCVSFSYSKKNIDDVRESPALDVSELLRQKGADVHYHDPYVPTVSHNGNAILVEPDLDVALAAANGALVVTDHSCYDWVEIRQKVALIVDTRHAAN